MFGDRRGQTPALSNPAGVAAPNFRNSAQPQFSVPLLGQAHSFGVRRGAPQLSVGGASPAAASNSPSTDVPAGIGRSVSGARGRLPAAVPPVPTPNAVIPSAAPAIPHPPLISGAAHAFPASRPHPAARTGQLP